MKKILSAVLALSLALPSVAAADGLTKKQWTATTLIAAGATVSMLSINWDMECPEGYRIHYFDNLPTQCSYVGRTFTDVTAASPKGGILSAPAFYSGLGAVGVGVLLLVLPTKAKKYAPSISASPQGVTVSKRINF